MRNAFAAYDALVDFDACSVDDLLAAHGLLLKGLSDDAGHFRAGGVGIYQHKKLVHMAPSAKQLPPLVGDLQHWLRSTEAHPLIASCAFHYELEFIHPFSDGNGRMGRLWQTLILSRWHPLLAYLTMETVIKHRQDEYYRLLGEADKSADCTSFIEFLLDAIAESLYESLVTELKTPVETLVETPVKTPQQILTLLAEHPHWPLAEVARSLGKSLSAIERAAAKLKQQGRLHRVGSRKGGHWQVSDVPVNSGS